MIEQFLQTALEFVKEIWFQLDSRFDLENTEAFKFIKPYLIQLQDNPLYMGISVAALFLVPYALIKVKSISRERERKLDELMEEMEEEDEYDDDDPRRLRRPEPGANAEVDDDSEKPLFGNDDDDDTTSYMDVLDEMEEKSDSTDEEFELDPPSSDNEEITDLEENAEPISSQLTESEFDKDLNEFMSLEENTEINDIDDSNHDQAIKELQEDGELMELDAPLSDDPLSENDPFDNYSDLDDDEQDKAIKDLQAEMERTISQLTEQIEEPAEPHNSIKDLSQIHIGGDTTIDDDYTHEEEFVLDDDSSLDTEKETPSSQEESSSVSELSDSEILASLEPELEDVLNHEAESESEEPETEYKEEPLAAPKTSDYEPELAGFTFEAESDIPEIEPEVSAENFTFEAESMSFEETTEELERDTTPSPIGETDSLIDRLKFLQTRFENRYQPTERSQEPAPSPAPIEKSIAAKDYVNFTEPRRYSSSPTSLPPDSKKYMDLLESFVFMKDQKKHK